MVTMIIYEPRCDKPGCLGHVTRKVFDNQGGLVGSYCTKHSGPALAAQTKSEMAQKQVAAVRS